MSPNDTNSETNTTNKTCEKGIWTKYSESKLIELENRILSAVKSTYKRWFVPIGPVVGQDDEIWTLAVNEKSENTPLVLLHGFGAGIGFWCMNLDDISKNRPVYAIDLLGFGRSSRPRFNNNHEVAEKQMVDSIEAWRKQLKLDQVILLGHSFGGYLATSYTIHYPERVRHLILADPWGFTERPPNFNPPLWIKTLGVLFYPLKYFNPLATVRAAGPMGPWIVRKARADISNKYEPVLEEKGVILEYIYHCNARSPTGETAFHNMLASFGWAKSPMIKRIDQIKKEVPITVMFGEDSWMSHEPGKVLIEQRQESYVKVTILEKAGHHIYSDQPYLFNEVVYETCELVDTGLDKTPSGSMGSVSSSKENVTVTLQQENQNETASGDMEDIENEESIIRESETEDKDAIKVRRGKSDRNDGVLAH